MGVQIVAYRRKVVGTSLERLELMIFDIQKMEKIAIGGCLATKLGATVKDLCSLIKEELDAIPGSRFKGYCFKPRETGNDLYHAAQIPVQNILRLYELNSIDYDTFLSTYVNRFDVTALTPNEYAELGQFIDTFFLSSSNPRTV